MLKKIRMFLQLNVATSFALKSNKFVKKYLISNVNWLILVKHKKAIDKL